MIGKYLAVTSIDSGTLHPTEKEKTEGWWTSEAARVFTGTAWSSPEYHEGANVTYSPRIASIHGLPYETHDECCDGFDEWYIFEQPIPPADMEWFVGWGGFSLDNPDYQWSAERFWEQMARLSPKSYLATAQISRSLLGMPRRFAS